MSYYELSHCKLQIKCCIIYDPIRKKLLFLRDEIPSESPKTTEADDDPK